MGPTSQPLLVLLLLLCGALLVGVARLGHWALKVGCGTLAMVLSVTVGVAAVNDFYGYYTSWSTLYGDLAGTPPALAVSARSDRIDNQTVRSGRVERIQLTGPGTHLSRPALVYLPPQYGDPKFAATRFPVVELLHGSPGQIANWVVTLQVARIADQLIAKHRMGPLVLVMPSINDGHHYEDCVNGKDAPDETYIASEVPALVRHRYRVLGDGAEWGVAGYSSGGYCAANLALRNRSAYGAAGVLDGYFRATDGPAGAELAPDAAALAANSPLQVAARLAPGTAPMPSFWITAGTGDPGDYAAARAFVAALRGITQPSLVVQPGEAHDYYAWSAAVPSLLAWMWQQLAPPQLRAQFPVIGPPTAVQVPPLWRPPVATPAAASPRPPTPTAKPTVVAAGAPPWRSTTATSPAPGTPSARTSTSRRPAPSPSPRPTSSATPSRTGPGLPTA